MEKILSKVRPKPLFQEASQDILKEILGELRRIRKALAR